MKRLLLFFLLILAIECHTQNITGQVVKIADGDTFTLLTDEKVQIRIRLYGEWSQSFSKVSRQFLSDLVFSKRVSVKVMDTDKYGRTVGVVFVEGVNMNEALLRGVWRGTTNNMTTISHGQNWKMKHGTQNGVCGWMMLRLRLGCFDMRNVRWEYCCGLAKSFRYMLERFERVVEFGLMFGKGFLKYQFRIIQ